jgi:glycosyltransferase involved in cell wall biosynthesis
MISEPLVSVSCLSFNHSSYIRQCLNGILSQKTNFSFEIVLYDDASTDGTVKIIQEYVSRFPNLFNVLIQKENQYSKGIRGIAPKFNFPRCRGKYIAFCEGDDFWTDPLKLQKQVDFLEKNPGFMMTCSNYSEVDSDGKIICENAWEGNKLAPVITNRTILERYKPKILTSVFRKESFDKPFPDSFFQSFNTDNFLCAIATSSGPASFLNFNSGSYRVHNQGVWSGKSQIGKYEMQLDTYAKMREYFLDTEQQIAIDNRIYNIQRKLSRLYFKNKRFLEGFSLVKILAKRNKVDSIKVLTGNLMSIIR